VRFRCVYNAKLRVNVGTVKSNEESESFSVAEAARKLGVSDTMVYRLIGNGQIKVIKGFGRIRVPRTELDKLVQNVGFYTPKKRGKKEVTAV
jgi:excisionase family DNA binding protein